MTYFRHFLKSDPSPPFRMMPIDCDLCSVQFERHTHTHTCSLVNGSVEPDWSPRTQLRPSTATPPVARDLPAWQPNPGRRWVFCIVVPENPDFCSLCYEPSLAKDALAGKFYLFSVFPPFPGDGDETQAGRGLFRPLPSRCVRAPPTSNYPKRRPTPPTAMAAM